MVGKSTWSVVLISLIGLLGWRAAAPNDHTVVYAIDTAVSRVQVLVYRGGTLRRLGHNHIISTGHVEGSVYLHPEATDSTVELTIPVGELIIDDASLRRKEGPDFASTPSQKDIAATQRNMLSKRLLDVAQFPVISITGSGLEIDAEQNATLDVVIQIKNTSATRRVPLTLDINAEQIVAHGVVDLTHAELGLRPFSALLGAMKVAETMTVNFSFTARRSDSPSPPISAPTRQDSQ